MVYRVVHTRCLIKVLRDHIWVVELRFEVFWVLHCVVHTRCSIKVLREADFETSG